MTKCENCGKSIDDDEALLCRGCVEGIDDYLAEVQSDELDSYLTTNGQRGE